MLNENKGSSTIDHLAALFLWAVLLFSAVIMIELGTGPMFLDPTNEALIKVTGDCVSLPLRLETVK